MLAVVSTFSVNLTESFGFIAATSALTTRQIKIFYLVFK